MAKKADVSREELEASYEKALAQIRNRYSMGIGTPGWGHEKQEWFLFEENSSAWSDAELAQAVRLATAQLRYARFSYRVSVGIACVVAGTVLLGLAGLLVLGMMQLARVWME